ncbi:MAG: acyltransferase [Desulfobacteraceae bacterium]|nr:MAG: acyltransferase [Desulfobacteraceae bacterium]
MRLFSVKIFHTISRYLYGLFSRWREVQEIRQIKESMHFCGEHVTIYPPVIFYGAEALDVGDNTSVAPFVHIWCGGRVIIGARCMIGSHAAITSLTHDYGSPEMWKTIEAKPVVIGDDVWIGSHAVILPGVTVGKGAVIGAGSVVSRDVPENAIVYGIPASVQGYRPQQH